MLYLWFKILKLFETVDKNYYTNRVLLRNEMFETFSLYSSLWKTCPNESRKQYGDITNRHYISNTLNTYIHIREKKTYIYSLYNWTYIHTNLQITEIRYTQLNTIHTYIHTHVCFTVVGFQIENWTSHRFAIGSNYSEIKFSEIKLLR